MKIAAEFVLYDTFSVTGVAEAAEVVEAKNATPKRKRRWAETGKDFPVSLSEFRIDRQHFRERLSLSESSKIKGSLRLPRVSYSRVYINLHTHTFVGEQ